MPVLGRSLWVQMMEPMKRKGLKGLIIFKKKLI